MAAIRLATARAVLITSLLLLGGCAFGTRQPSLIYPPTPESGSTPPDTASAARKNIRIVLNPFADQRKDKKAVGTVRNALGMKTAEVIPTNAVDAWVTEAVQKELAAGGYDVSVEQPGSEASNSNIVVSGEILNVFCDMYFSYTGQVTLVVRVKQAGKDILYKHYAGEGSAGLAVAMTAEAYAQSLALALSSALKGFVADLDGTLGQR